MVQTQSGHLGWDAALATKKWTTLGSEQRPIMSFGWETTLFNKFNTFSVL